MSIVTIKNKYQVVIPTSVRQEAGVAIGDVLEARVEKGKITLTPKILVDRRKLARLPKSIRDSLEDIRKGKVSGPFNSVDALMRHLKR